MLAGGVLGGAFVVAASLVAHGRIGEAAGRLGGEHALPLLAAAICAPVVPAATAGAWRSVLGSGGVRLTRWEAWGCYGLGCVANTALPGRAGDALRIELFSRRVPRRSRRWLACGVSTSVGVAQSLVLALVLCVGALLGAVPAWATVPSLALPAATWAAARVALRRRPGERVACLATAATLSPGGWARALGWVLTAAAARLLLAAAVLEALSVPHPARAAVVAICGLAVGSALPFAPGAAGVAAATMSVALRHTGLETGTALAAAVSFHAFETAAGLLFGASGWLVLRVAERGARRPPLLLEPDRVLAARAS